MPVGAFVFEADRREHQARAGGECDLASAHGLKAQIGLAETGLGFLAALERTDDNRGQGPGELRLPEEIDVAELRTDPEIISAAARAQLAEAAVDPALLPVDSDEADISDELERVGREQFQRGFSARR